MEVSGFWHGLVELLAAATGIRTSAMAWAPAMVNVA
jgi:hypothetical protein